MKESPIVSVVLPVYNGEKFLSEAIESVLNQTFGDFELVIINDGSTDSSLSIIQNFMSEDTRIKLIDRENKGLVTSLNEGIAIAKGQYIARMDADDICLPTRLSEQVSFLEKHPTVAVLGTQATMIDENGLKIGSVRTLKYNYLIKGFCFFSSPFIHPSVMLNRHILSNHLYYSSEYLHAEDYELWSRISLLNEMKFANLSQHLLKYRIVKNSISRKNAIQQQVSSQEVISKYLIKENHQVNNNDRFKQLLTLIFFQKQKKYLPFQIANWFRVFFK